MTNSSNIILSKEIDIVVKILLSAIIFFSINVKLGEVKFLSIQLINLISVISFVLCFFLTSGFKSLTINNLQFYFILFLLYIILNSYFNPNSNELSFTSIFLMFRFLSLILLMKLVGKPTKVLNYIALSVLFVALVSILEITLGRTFFANEWQGGERYNELGMLVIGSTIASSNHLSLTLIFTLPLVHYLYYKNNNYFYKVVFLIILLSVFLTFSRTGVLLLVLTLGALFLRKAVSSKIWMFCLILIPFVIVFYHAALLMNYSSLESFVFESSNSDESIKYRLYVLFVLLETFLKNPFFGLGNLGSFKKNSVDFFSNQSFYQSEVDTSPMNTYIGTLTELGIIGAIIFGIVIYKMLVISWDYYKNRNSIFHYNVFIIVMIFLINIIVIDASTFPLLIILIAIVSVFHNKKSCNEISQKTN